MLDIVRRTNRKVERTNPLYESKKQLQQVYVERKSSLRELQNIHVNGILVLYNKRAEIVIKNFNQVRTIKYV